MRRLASAILMVTLAVLIGAVVALAATSARGDRQARFSAGGRSHAAKLSPSQRQLARNKRAARADAKRLLTAVRFPAGTTRSAKVPAGSHGLLQPLSSLEVVYTSAVSHAWFIVPSTAADPYDFVNHHRPPGTQEVARGGSSGPHGSTQSLEFFLHGKRDELYARVILVDFTTLSDGDTGVLVESQSSWIIPRPTAERVPSEARKVLLRLVKTKEHGKAAATSTARSHVISAQGRLAKLERTVNSLPIAQDFLSAGCGSFTTGQSLLYRLTLRFETRAGKTLASAGVSWTRYDDPVGSWCNPISFTLGHRSEPDLVDTRFLAQLRRITGLKLR